MRINHRRCDIGVPEQLLNCTDVVSRLKQVRGKTVAQRMRCCRLVDSGIERGLPDCALNRLILQMVTTNDAGARIDR